MYTYTLFYFYSHNNYVVSTRAESESFKVKKLRDNFIAEAAKAAFLVF